jgi:hypothetical protein
MTGHMVYKPMIFQIFTVCWVWALSLLNLPTVPIERHTFNNQGGDIL